MLWKFENLQVNICGKDILNRTTLQIRKGEQLFIFGMARAGKTVLANTLSGNHAFQGVISFSGFGKNLLENSVIVVAQ